LGRDGEISATRRGPITGHRPAQHVRIGPNRREEAGLLFAAFDFSSAHADEFHDRCDLEHIPERLRVPGFINAERWIDEENPRIAVATFDLDSLDVLQSAPYQAIGYGNSSVWRNG
jgi:hypothetical protein